MGSELPLAALCTKGCLESFLPLWRPPPIPPLPRRLAPALVAPPVPLPAVCLEVGRDAHLVAAGPTGRFEPDRFLEDLADRHVGQRLRARHALGAGVAVVGEAVR